VCLCLRLVSTLAAEPVAQISIPLVERMPAVPQPFRITDWKSRARDYDRLAFNETAQGESLPLLKMADGKQFTLPSYVGARGGGEGICTISSVVGATLAGIDKSNQPGRNWAAMCREWYNPDPAIGVVLNGPGSQGGGSFWYDILPGILFSQLTAQYPTVDGLESIFRAQADRYRKVVESLGGPNADFNFTTFDFRRNVPRFNGRWREPDASAGIGYLEYAAWRRFGDRRHLEAADWCMAFLQRRPVDAGSPLYETLLYYAPVLAARLNAEEGRDYDVSKLVNWCLSENQEKTVARPGWGILAIRCGDYDIHGLQGSTTDRGGYAFAMNTFNAAGAMAPLPRYDPRFARAIGRWLLNVANNARLFYQDGLPDTHQAHPGWKSDPANVITYEGLRARDLRLAIPASEETSRGQRQGDLATLLATAKPVTFTPADGVIEHTWHWQIPADARTASWGIALNTKSPERTFRISARTAPDSPWKAGPVFPRAGNKPGERLWIGSDIGDAPAARDIWLKLETLQPAPNLDLRITDVRVRYTTGQVPYASGDPSVNNPGPATQLAVYGAAYVGYLAAIIDRTNCDHILHIDLLATDFFHDKAYPSYLYYNPDPQPLRVRIPVGPVPRDLYDTVTRDFFARSVTGDAEITLPADTAAVIVIVPAGGQFTRRGNRTLIDSVVVGYR
jgi:hypothetical protein